MTDLPTVSVVIASRGRPKSLTRCLTAIAQLDHPQFEVVVVADPPGLEAARRFPVKCVACDVSNISAARNLGITAAAGEVVAFIDDDAVPEPPWLRALSAPFSNPDVAAAGGTVLGRNGISFQWKRGMVDRLLQTSDLDAPEGRTSLHRTKPGSAIEIKGVNCAYRRSVLAGLGGFDPDLRYYLDETELNLRLAAIGAVTAVVPDARVHHAKAASDIRRADRTPRSLWDVGASSAVTLRRHAASAAETEAARQALLGHERRKLLGLMVAGRLEPRDIAALENSLAAGFSDGLSRKLGAMPALPDPPTGFLPFPARATPATTLAGRPWQIRRLRRQAQDIVRQGATVRLLVFSPTARFHRISYELEGFWLQRGGLFGKSLRSDAFFSFWSFQKRRSREISLWEAGVWKT